MTFLELTIIFIFAFLTAFVFRLLKQPLIISYIFTGLLLGNFLLTSAETKNLITIFSELGIAFLLFVVGLELKLKTLREISKPSIIIGTLQEVLTIAIGFLVAKFLGFSTIVSLYLGTALSFSSTIIMVKLITDKGDLEKLYGKLAIGFLLIQDLITILILFLLPILSKSELFLNPWQLVLSLLAIFLIPYFSIKFLPRIENFLAKSQEFLFLFSLTFGLGIGSLFKYLGFGLEAGALIAGVSLSTLTISSEIASKLKPLRDFFLVLFFIYIGSQAFISDFDNIFYPALILSLFVLIGNPLIMLFILGPLGYTSKTSFLLGLTSAQISEFSFILISLGIKLGHLNQEILSLTSLVGLITIFISTYLFVYADKIYLVLKDFLKIFEKRREEKEKEKIAYEIILMGCDRTGSGILSVLKNLNRKFLVVDYNLEVVNKLKKENIEVAYGDAEEIDFLNELNLKDTQLVISTIPDYETNLLILKEYKKQNPNGIFLGVSHVIQDTLDLYKQGADFIIMPHYLAGEYVGLILEKYGFNKEEYQKLKEKQLSHFVIK